MMTMGEAGAPVPPWTHFLDDTFGAAGAADEYLLAAAALRNFLPSNEVVSAEEEDDEFGGEAAMDAYASDEFRMYEFKVRRCSRGRSHDWTECPFAHPGEKARRRDPRRFHYSGAACPDFRKGGCKRGDGCEFAHGVFECWLHPSRYRTQPCKDGIACRRRVCFFAHTPEQLRVLPQLQSPRGSPPSPTAGSSAAADSYDGSPLRRRAALESHLSKKGLASSPTSTLASPPRSPTSESPPLSPAAAFHVGSPVRDMLTSLRQLRIGGNVKTLPRSWVLTTPPSYSPARAAAAAATTQIGGAVQDPFDLALVGAQPAMERVESGQALREKMFQQLSMEGMTTKPDAGAAAAPDVGWVSDLLN